MRGWLLASTLALGACAAEPRLAPTVPLRAACSADDAFDGKRCHHPSNGRALVDRAADDLAEFRADEARAALERAAGSGPFAYPDWVRLHEELGVAYAYLDDEPRALAAFDELLTAAPGHAIRYTLSPKATFAFEKARAAVLRRPAAELRVSWPRDLDVARAVPIEVEVVADPKARLARARLLARKKGDSTWRRVDFDLPRAGAFQRVELPPLAPSGVHGEVLQLYVVGCDAAGNEVHTWGSAARPREIPVGHRPAPRWYERWWVWTAVGSAVAAATGVAVFAATREPPSRVDGTFTTR